MGLDKHEKQIGENLYEVTLLDARTGYRLGLKITKALARGARKGGELDDVKGGETLRVAMLGKVIQGLANAIESLPEEDLTHVIETFAKTTSIRMGENSAPPLSKVFDLHFAGKYDEMLQWIEFCLEVNYGPLVAGVKAKAAAAFATFKSGVKPGLARTEQPSSSTSPTA